MKHFITLFPHAKNVHLVKDVGQVPYHMQRHFGYRSTLVCYKNEDKYSFLKDEVQGLKLHFLTNSGRRFFWEKAVISYLFKYSAKIDVLHLHHLTQESMLYGLIYKLLNPFGTLYLKLDMDIYHYHKRGIRFSDVKWKEKIYQKIYPSFIKIADVISIETRKGQQYLKSLNKHLYEKSIVIQNGNDCNKIKQKTGEPVFTQKEDLILTVGRIGTQQKNSQLLLQALSRIKLGPWKVVFVGPIEDHFQSVIRSFFKKYPHKRDHILFTGAITDRMELMNYYKKAKIFCLTSRWESFGIALTEAQCMGGYIIGTNKIPPMDELTRGNILGMVIESENVEALVSALQKAMQADFYTKPLMDDIIRHAQQYNWPSILKKLDRHLRNPPTSETAKQPSH